VTPPTVPEAGPQPVEGPPLCATCGMSIYEDGWYSETRGEYGHDCDGTEAMCARRCPIEVPVEVQVACHPAQEYPR
jgi:hypothetical protein